MMDAPYHRRATTDARRQTADQVRMIHPGMNQIGRKGAKLAGKSQEAARIWDAWLHAHRINGDARGENRTGDGQVIDERDDGESEAIAVGAQKQIAEHRFGSAKLEAVNDMHEVNLVRHARIALPAW